MLKILISSFFILFTLQNIFSQSESGLQVYYGLSTAKSQNSLLTPSGLSHKGYHIGADGRLNSGNMYFMLGGQYHVMNFIAGRGGNFSIKDKMTWMKLRFGLGYNVINFTEKIALRAKTLLALDFIGSYPDNLEGAPFQMYNSGTAGAVAGIGVDVYAFTFDIEYEKGFFNAVNMVDDTSFNFWLVNVGVKF